MAKNRKKKPISLALDPDILDRVDAWIGSQKMPVTKSWVHETALREFMEKRDEQVEVPDNE
tara:strand:- start:23889 stop:24071 length:183 start_codon:yes stop_codon:yes gene_type:complete